MQTKPFWMIAFGVVCGLLAAGVLLWATRLPVGQPIALLPPPSPAPVVVHVTGAVAAEGVYSLSPGSRVEDAIAAAGGLLPDAEPSSLNLAALLEDGKRISVPRKAPTPTPKPTKPSSGTAPTAVANPGVQPTPEPPVESTAGGLININTATLEELDTLPGIGPSIAQRIMDYRDANGPFATIEDIQNVKGIGPAIFEKLKDLITVGD